MYEVNNTYNPYGANVTFKSTSVYRTANTSMTSQNEKSNCRMGQYRVITSAEQPHMAEVVDLCTFEVGTQNVSMGQSAPGRQIRTVNGGGHMPDPFFTPIGDVILPLLLCALVFGFVRRWRTAKK